MHKEDSDEDFDIKEDDMEDMPSEWVLCPSVIRSEDNYNEDSDDNAGEVDSTKRRRTRASYSFRGHPWSDDSSDDGDKSSKLSLIHI